MAGVTIRSSLLFRALGRRWKGVVEGGVCLRGCGLRRPAQAENVYLEGDATTRCFQGAMEDFPP